MKSLSSKYIPIVLHCLFWVISFVFLILFFERASRDYNNVLIFSAMLFPLAIATTYFINYYLIPKFLFTKKYATFALFIFYTLVVSIWIEMTITTFVFISINNYKIYKMDPSTFDAVLLFVGLYFIIIVAVTIKLIRHSFRLQHKNISLETVQLTTELKLKEAELKLLKAQIQPHFLFNTLNNLYGLTLEKSEEAPSLVLRLSDILDYILYRCNEKYVPLVEEIKNLTNYIEIEKIRHTSKLTIEVSVPKDTGTMQVAPLLLIPFVENAFKHGVSNNPGKSFLKLKLDVVENVVHFDLCNSKNSFSITETKGIGLKNVKKRLELIYPDKYKLEIDDKEAEFCVHLVLKTHSDV